ncbi:hypothetical protein DPMN_007352 [Dreissena polymorpha]|uniref:Uncharacterized protein n=1 Tax=Dreissena polymorpha TaxID=45954 RepID=A0A9D4RYN1_DREPO|nr:hypothetical protein DPMN_007352 [Dreissena polymorpha]
MASRIFNSITGIGMGLLVGGSVINSALYNGVQSLHPLDVTPLVITPSKPGHYTHQDID